MVELVVLAGEAVLVVDLPVSGPDAVVPDDGGVGQVLVHLEGKVLDPLLE